MGEDYKRKIVSYFKKNLKKGYTEDALKWALINQGYSRIIIDSAAETATKELAQEAPVIKEKPVIKHVIIDESGRQFRVKKPWWKRIFG